MRAGPISAGILDEDAHRRLRAVDAMELDVAGLHALRNALVLDEDARVRERAAQRLGSAEATRAYPGAEAALAEALGDALRDGSPAVREAAAETAGRRRAEGLATQLAELTRLDPSFRVRRAAVRALADAVDERAIPALSDALDNPFWRVRYAAVQVLARWPHAELGAEPASPRRRAARAYLESVWSGALALDAVPSEPALVLADAVGPDAPARSPIEDDNPAVTAARLATAGAGEVRGADLVAFLADPHASLRRAASRLLLQRGDPGELLAALAWLDEPRVPYASATVSRLLGRVDTRPLVAAVLGSVSAGPGALAWALDEAARRGHDALAPAARRAMEHADVRVRRAAVRALVALGAVDALLAARGDADEECRAEAIRGCPGAPGAEESPALPPGGGVLVERAWIAVARCSTPEGALRAALTSTWASVRAEAVAELAHRGLLGEEAREQLADDPDPWVRAAALDAGLALSHLEIDPDPGVRRAAMRALLRGRAAASAAERPRIAGVAGRSDDPWIRARAADLLDGVDDDNLVLLLLLTRDRAPMVRAAAADAIDRLGNPVSRCARLLEAGAMLPEDVRLAAHAQLSREPDARSLAALTRELAAPDLSPRARETLLAMRLVYPGAELPPPRPEPRAVVVPSRTDAPAPVVKRALGNTGLAVAPLGISGAFELPVASLEHAREAGVDLFFWEPDHRELTRFVASAPRRDNLVVTTGSYEADPRSIERDVNRALARLDVDALGVMLLFWVRSRARLTDEAFATLERLKERGKVKAIGFSTHLRDVALEAIVARPWDVIMVRHSAAHPGAERALLPAAAARGVGVIAFSALLYGRMLAEDVTAADCYRYVVSQPGVSVCLSAPRRFRELSDDLEVLRRPPLDAAEVARLRAHGARVHAQNRAFTTLVRRP